MRNDVCIGCRIGHLSCLALFNKINYVFSKIEFYQAENDTKGNLVPVD